MSVEKIRNIRGGRGRGSEDGQRDNKEGVMVRREDCVRARDNFFSYLSQPTPRMFAFYLYFLIQLFSSLFNIFHPGEKVTSYHPSGWTWLCVQVRTFESVGILLRGRMRCYFVLMTDEEGMG